jgi:hypothetical protein
LKHFNADEWIDYVRKVQTPDAGKKMENHLASCEECLASFRFWSEVTSTAVNDLSYAPPEDALRIAKAQFSEVARPRVPWHEALAKLVFDSSTQPLAHGMRSSGSICRQVLYQHGERFLDLRIEKLPEKSQISLIGQIQESAAQPIDSVLVVLHSEGKVLQQTETNSMGEFHLVFAPSNDLYLEIDREGKSMWVRVPLVSEIGS